MSEPGRDTPCPCGVWERLEVQALLLLRQDAASHDVARAEGIWGSMQECAFEHHGDPLGAHMTARGVDTVEAPAMDDDSSLALRWLLIDRDLADGGGTPAQRYAERPGLSESERAMARRIAVSWLAPGDRGCAGRLDRPRQRARRHQHPRLEPERVPRCVALGSVPTSGARSSPRSQPSATGSRRVNPSARGSPTSAESTTVSTSDESP